MPRLATAPSPVICGLGGMPVVTDTEMFFVTSYPTSKVTVILFAFAVPSETSCPFVAMVVLEWYGTTRIPTLLNQRLCLNGERTVCGLETGSFTTSSLEG